MDLKFTNSKTKPNFKLEVNVKEITILTDKKKHVNDFHNAMLKYKFDKDKIGELWKK